MPCSSANDHLEEAALARRCFFVAFLPCLRWVRSLISVRFSNPMRLLVPGHNALRDHMIGVLLQPSLPSTDGNESPRCRTGAFLLQTLSQSRIVVSFGNDSLPRIERMISLCRRSYRQIANTNIHTSYTNMSVRCWLCYLYLKGNQQVEVFLWFIVPEFSRTDVGTLGNQSHMLMVTRVGYNHASTQGQDAQVLTSLEAIIFAVLIGQRRRDILRRLVKPFVAFLCFPCFTQGSILLDLCPQRLVGSSYLSRNATGHLGWQMKTGTNFIVGSILQSNFIAHFVMLKRIVTHIIERVTI